MKLYILKLLSCLLFLVDLTLPQSKYHTYKEMTDELLSLVSIHKHIAKLESIGKTIENREIWVITVGKNNTESKHAVLVVGGVEAEQLIGSELSINFLKYLLNNYGKVDSITNLVNSTTFYIIPRVNPDASEEFFQKPLYVRKYNARPIDDDKDWLVDEDGCEDLNGDGFITMMRVKDNQGEWLPHPDDTRIMKKADPSKGEKGIYKLYTEGIDNDKDEQWNEDEKGGVDFNRNFPHNYQFFSRGAGPHQISENETRAVIDFCFDHPNIAIVFTFSSNDNLMNPWKKESSRQGPSQQEQRYGRRRFVDDEQPSQFITTVMEEDEQYFSFVSKRYQDITKFKSAPQSVKGEGAFSEWAYYHFGRWSFSANPWWIPEVETKKDSSVDTTKKESRTELKKGKGFDEKQDECAEQLKYLKWIDENKIPNGFIPWTKVKHPDFPDKEVEVGGFKPYVLNNPPADSINIIAGRINAFLGWLGLQLPAIEIQNVRVESIDGKLFRLNMNITNNGYFPTNSAIGNKARWPRNVKVSLDLTKGQSLASGKSIIILEPIQGSGASREVSWLIVSKPDLSVTITAESPTAGKATKTVTLK